MLPIEDIEKQVEIVRRVAAGYEIGSVEESALRLAALALRFVAIEHFDRFEEFRKGEELTAEQRAHLDSVGLKY